jgi:hypothetical protein
MTDENTMARLAAIEAIVGELLVDALRGSIDPIAEGQRFINRAYQNEAASRGSGIPEGLAIKMTEAVVAIIEKAMQTAFEPPRNHQAPE